jgi:hypothetical protein
MVQSQWDQAADIVFEGIREYLSDEEYNNIYRDVEKSIQKYITPSKPKMRGYDHIQVMGSVTESHTNSDEINPDKLEEIFHAAVKKFVKEEKRQKNICEKVSNIIKYHFEQE